MPLRFLAILFVAATALGAAPAGAGQVGQATVASLDSLAPDNAPEAASWHIVREVTKQAAEQPLHFIMAAAPIWLSRSLTAVPWYGWAIVPALAYREWRQWPSKRWWDPLLDAGFLVLGVLSATWPARTLPGPSALFWLHRRARRTFPLHPVPRRA